MTRFPYIRAAAIAGCAVIVGVVVTKDTGLVHGTLDTAALYCENYEAWLNDPGSQIIDDDGHIIDAPPVHFDADQRAECEDDYRSLPLDAQREILHNIMSDDG